MSIVVTGATGHLGRLVVEHLLELGTPAQEIVATGRSVDRIADLAARGVRTAVADFDDPATLTAAFDGAETVLLVSGSEVGRRVPQHTAAIEAARAAGVRRVVYTSAPHADTTPLALAAEHRATEEVLRASGLTWTVLRNNWYHENYLPVLDQAAATGVVVSSTGAGRVASAPRDDYAAAAAVVLSTDGHDDRVYELSGDVAWTHDDLAAAAAEVLGTPVVHRAVPADEHRAILEQAGLDAGTIAFLVGLDEGIARGDLADATADLRTLVGRPTVPLVETLRAARA
ncbi:SDR family oxidoreductase [Cellulomonas fimi]|uniref:NmrA family protein n=1 Tax=Cellulomonas fimi (strain ATCC 484 / DSM 20113 / JCM 1341 / CCUG 24087 / LMG 16345 / NBRC 15513 / NCIMB 8980 / NCTC 7547 / NRS-133) TaxID=590998 RepID=F4H4J4_CELFA|nr:SDR family oxidoreductase [Cellulomonas fimi]AEE47789.1 NmrA family protein [Cellulomonas fimi ATCC 484]NNH06675.1 SDR family oxidoreductase [Cellulomonas fimi]VEH37005.1 Quinone oxidoreductase 2 [Cellulomonas fimi]